LFSQARVEAIYSFENAFERFFPGVDSRMKFLTLVFEKRETAEQSFPAAFMLRDENFLALPEPERLARSVPITTEFIRLTSPAYLSIIELREDKERELVQRIYETVPPLSRVLQDSGSWNVEIHRELHMGDDAWRFRTREWLLQRGCEPRGNAFVAPHAEYYRSASSEYVPGIRYVLWERAKYRVTSQKPSEAQEKRRGARGQRMEVVRGFLRRERADDENEMLVAPGATYVPLYEGRMVHQFDHTAKAYVSGEGRGAKWRDLDLPQKAIVPHFFVEPSIQVVRAGFCQVTGQTNERSLLATAIPAGHPAGDKVPTIQSTGPAEAHSVWITVANSFVADWLLRQKISTTVNFFFLETLPFLRPNTTSPAFSQLARLAARLVSITPEIQLAEPALDLRERARLRAEIDAMVAGLYGLSSAEFAYILTTFPLLDRDQPPLPGDFFVRWDKRGKAKEEPRSFVTRDTALLAYFRHLNLTSPDDLAAWYRDNVGINMIDDPSCPYRIGAIRGLEDRVAEYQRRGAIAYIPSKAKHWDPNGPYQPLKDQRS
jgi:hypothetical protein